MTSILTLRALRRLRTTPGGQLDCRIDFSDGPGTSRPVAYVERELPPGGVSAYLAARKNGVRSFVLWADEHRPMQPDGTDIARTSLPPCG
ncbi:hypothetical protein [Streptomyces formicae]|uniref:Uncharacterized protein n=1 Tax=Streptomyces formicae TaxID=1616117 RepID=A0ABY3WW74_9ACTN|nr:hypothetical protein [Streptomyces formicae]UNM16906.1 hypothetical protein J4032_09270 [Streptomyces formicae]